MSKRKPQVALAIEKITTRAWAHPPEGVTLDELEQTLTAKGYTILDRGECPANGRPGLLINDSDRSN